MAQRKPQYKKRIRPDNVKILASKPPFIPDEEGNAVQERGLKYEQRVVEYVRNFFYGNEVHHGLWFEYEVRGKRKWASPDIVIMTKPIVLVECKLTATKGAIPKLVNLYEPLVRAVFDGPVRPVQVAGGLRRGFNHVPRIKKWDDILDEKDWEPSLLIWRV